MCVVFQWNLSNLHGKCDFPPGNSSEADGDVRPRVQFYSISSPKATEEETAQSPTLLSNFINYETIVA